MPFTNVWDTTQPPDTQLANLLGQDIRNLKVDVMQRMSYISGTLLNRPTPETVNAIWGSPSAFGILYFASDTLQVFQWDGANWNQVFFNINLQKMVDPATYTASSFPITTSGVSIPAYAVRTNSFFSGRAWGASSTGSGNSLIQYTLNGTAISANTPVQFTYSFAAYIEIQFLNSTTARAMTQIFATNNTTLNNSIYSVTVGGLTAPYLIQGILTPGASVSIVQQMFQGQIIP